MAKHRVAAISNVPRVIGLCGPEGAGKSTVARMLVNDHGYTLVPFAKPLKDMLAVLGVDYSNLWGTPAEKAAPLPLLCGRSARHAMQALGTQWGRELVGEDLWTRAWAAAADKALAKGAVGVVADDVRFANEAALTRSFGGSVWCVVRKRVDFQRVPQHASEDFAALPRDGVIYNSGSLERLAERVDAAVSRPRKFRRAA